MTGYLPFRVWYDSRSGTPSPLADLTQVLLERLCSHDAVAKACLLGIGSAVCRCVWRLIIRRSIAVMPWYSDT